MNTTEPTPRYTAAVGVKFFADGSPCHYPGNTILCRIPEGSDLQAGLTAVQLELIQLSSRSHWIFLPPESFHMTVMELLCDQERQPEKWSRFLSLSAPLPECDRFFQECLSAVEAPREIRMRVVGIYAQEVIVVVVQPADDATVQALFDYRERVAQATGVRFQAGAQFSRHEGYIFHITLAYKLIELEREAEAELSALAARVGARLAEESGVIALPAPRLVFFENLFAFHDQRRVLTE